MRNNNESIIKIILSLFIFSLAGIYAYFLYYEKISIKLDSTFLILIILGALIHLIDWKSITTFKAAGIELTLNEPIVAGALHGLKIIEGKDRIKLGKKLLSLEPKIKKAKGSRILWIDEHPKGIIGERRLMRALGIEIVTAKDSESAQHKIEEDGDFDLIISDVQRIGWGDIRKKENCLFELPLNYREYLKEGLVDKKLIERFEDKKQHIAETEAKMFKKDDKRWIITFEKENRVSVYIIEDTGKELNVYKGTIVDGLFFAANLRNSDDPVIKKIPVIFYTGYGEEALRSNIEDVTSELEIKKSYFYRNADFCSTIDSLLETSISVLSHARSYPIEVEPKKPATSPGA